MVLAFRRVFFSLVVVFLVIGFVQPARAAEFLPTEADQTGYLNTSGGDGIDLGSVSPTVVALNLINAALSLLAAVCVGLLIYAGFLWVWARGNQDEVTKSKDIIRGTVIGLVIVLAALGITQFVFQTVGDITGAVIVTGEDASTD